MTGAGPDAGSSSPGSATCSTPTTASARRWPAGSAADVARTASGWSTTASAACTWPTTCSTAGTCWSWSTRVPDRGAGRCRSPSSASAPTTSAPGRPVDAHGMDPATVLAALAAGSAAGCPARTLLVGCQVADTGDGMGLTPRR